MTAWTRRAAAIVACALLATGCASTSLKSDPLSGAKYVALGSSFAAGPGVTTSADTPPNRCGRSADNYARQLARRRGLQLVDVSCGGASTRHLLGPWSELPPQLDAVTADARLVTITIGGNDLNYIGGLFAASCRQRALEAQTSSARCPSLQPPTEQAFEMVEAQMRAIAAEVRRRAPRAQLIFVDYPAVLPTSGVCAATPMSAEDAERGRQIAQRLVEVTRRAAQASGADYLAASSLSEGHDACSSEPWMNGYSPAGQRMTTSAYHPNLAGMTAVAEALDRMLR